MQKRRVKPKLNRRLQLILLLLPLVLTLYAESVNLLPNASEMKFRLDSTKSYTAQEVQELLDIVVEEAEKSITEAYNAGYKQGVIEFKPDVSYWKTKAEEYERQFLLEHRKKWRWALSGFGIGILGGAGITIGVRLWY